MLDTIPTLQVDTPGLLTTVQDCGRTGYSGQGIPVCGAMERCALQCENLLTGAARGAAALEITLLGPGLTVLTDCTLALAGADLGMQIDGQPAAPWRSYFVLAGSKIIFRRPRTSQGSRAYLALSGGLDVPVVLGSRSTCLSAGFGGFEGRSLLAGDLLNAYPLAQTRPGRALKQSEPASPKPILRIIRGPEWTRFTLSSRRRILREPYTVSQASNRMGYRLTGPALAFRRGAQADIITESALFGTIQVTSDGLPLLLMADHQTTGGYARIGTVISTDLKIAAQLAPGDQVWFEEIGLAEAEILAVEQEKYLRLLERTLTW